MFAYSTDRAPVYVMRFAGHFDAADEGAYLAALRDLVERPAGFVLLLVMENENRMSPAGYREMALWFKAERQRLAARCRGLVRVRPGHAGDPADDANFRKAMPFPTARAEDEAAGWRLAETLAAAR